MLGSQSPIRRFSLHISDDYVVVVCTTEAGMTERVPRENKAPCRNVDSGDQLMLKGVPGYFRIVLHFQFLKNA